MTPEQEAKFEMKAEKHFSGHRELKNGANFLHWNRDPDPIGEKNYRDNYDATFGKKSLV